MAESGNGLLVELSRPISSDEEAKISTFMRVRNIDRLTAMKFLMGRKMDVDRAHLLLTNYQRIILERHFESVVVTDVAKELKSAKMYIPGSTDRNKAQLLVIDATKHDPAAFSHDDTIRLAFFMGHKVTERPSVWEHGLTLIVNLSGYTWAQWDMALQRQILGLFTDNIPARVKNILLFDAPWWISSLVRIVSPFLKQKMRERLQLCDKDNIQNWVEAANLPVQFGGRLQYDHEGFMERCIEDIGEDQFRHKLHLNTEGREITAVPIEELFEVLPESLLSKKIDLEPSKREALEQERADAVTLFEERIEMLKESSKNNRVKEHKDFFHLLRYRATRLSLDLSMLQQRPQPNMSESHSVKSVSESPITEIPGEDTDPDALRKRIKKDIEAKIAKNTGKPYMLSLDSDDDDITPEKREDAPVAVKSPEVINEDLEAMRRRAPGQRRPVVNESKEDSINLSSSSDDANPAITIESSKQIVEAVEAKPKQEGSATGPSAPSEPAASPNPQRRGRRGARVKPIDSSFEPPILPVESKQEAAESPRPKSDDSSESSGIAVIPPLENVNRESLLSMRPISSVTNTARDSVASIRPLSSIPDVNRTSMTSLAPVNVPLEQAKPEPLGPINEGMEELLSSMSGNRRRARKRSEDAGAHRQAHIVNSPK